MLQFVLFMYPNPCPSVYLIAGCESGPWFVGAPVILASVRDLQVVVKLDDLLLSQLLYRRPETQLGNESSGCHGYDAVNHILHKHVYGANHYGTSFYPTDSMPK